MKYESVIVLKVDSSEKQINELTDLFKKYVNKITLQENLGIRRLAYIINGYDEGIYILYEFNGNEESIEPLKNELDMNENVLKRIIIKHMKY